MKINLPVVTRDEIVDKKRVTEYGEKTFKLDPSLNCQMRWERCFPNAEEDLTSYAERIKNIKENSVAVIISKMKTLYCFFDTELSFTEFLQLFDFSNAEYIKKLTDRITEVFQIVFDGASEKN